MVSNHVMDLIERYGFDSEIPAALTEYVKARKFYDYKDHSRVGAAHGEFVTDEIVDRFCVLGTPAQATEKLRELESVGVDQFNIYLMTNSQEPTLEAYGKDIIPQFSRRRRVARLRAPRVDDSRSTVEYWPFRGRRSFNERAEDEIQKHAGLLAAAFAAGLLAVAGATLIGGATGSQAARGSAQDEAWATRGPEGERSSRRPDPARRRVGCRSFRQHARGRRRAESQLRVSASRQGGARQPDPDAGEDAPAPQPRADLRALRASAGPGQGSTALARRERLPDHARRRGSHGALRVGSDRDRREGAAREDRRLREARHSTFQRHQGEAVRLLREHDRADGSGAPRPAEHLGPQRRRPLLHQRAALRGAAPDAGGADAGRRQRDHQPALRRRAERRLLPVRPARPLRHHRPRLRRRPARRSASRCGRPPSARRDDRVRDRHRRPADHGRSRAASRPATRRPRPSSCATQTVAPDHLLSILENGNSTRTPTSAPTSRRRSTSRPRTASRRTSAMKYYAVGVRPRPAAGLGPRQRRLQRHRRRHGRGDGGRRQRPDAAQRLEQLGLRRRGRVGHGRPVHDRHEQHPRARRGGGHELLLLDRRRRHVPVRLPDRQPVRRLRRRHEHLLDERTPPTWSTSTTWSGGGSWCSNIVARPSWQTAPASRPTPRARAASSRTSRRSPIPNTGVRFTSSTNLTGGTSEPARSAARASRRRS